MLHYNTDNTGFVVKKYHCILLDHIEHHICTDVHHECNDELEVYIHLGLGRNHF